MTAQRTTMHVAINQSMACPPPQLCSMLAYVCVRETRREGTPSAMVARAASLPLVSDDVAACRFFLAGIHSCVIAAVVLL